MEFEKHKFRCYENPIFIRDVNIANILISRFLLVKKIINILLVTKMMIIKLNRSI